MKVITLYQAVDGSNWPTEADALRRDQLCAEVSEAMAILGPTTDRRHSNGQAFIQHRAEDVLAAKRRIVELCALHVDHKVFSHPAERIHVRGLAGRILDHAGGPLSVAWGRLARIDDFAREWEQQYFAMNPNPDAKEAGCATA